ncbi:MAG: putative signal peptide protein, partial [Actinomycetota bacterium]
MRIRDTRLRPTLRYSRARSAISLLSLVAVLGAITASPTAAIDSTPIILTFAGDVHFEEQLKSQAKSGGLKSFEPLFADSDIAMLNLETSLTNRGKAENKTYTFRADP